MISLMANGPLAPSTNKWRTTVSSVRIDWRLIDPPPTRPALPPDAIDVVKDAVAQPLRRMRVRSSARRILLPDLIPRADRTTWFDDLDHWITV